MAESTHLNRHVSIIKIVSIYALFGFLWIYTSDTILGLFILTTKEIATQIAIFKGSAFIVITSLLLYFLIKQYDKKTAQSEQAAIASKQRFEEFFQKIADPIYIVDIDGNIIAANDQSCRELGYPLEDLLRMRLADIDVSVNTSEVFTANLSLLAKHPITFETRHRRKDGSIFPVEVNVCLIDLSGQQAVMGVARNISKRKHTEDYLAFLAQTAADPTGEDFFHRLARYLASSLHMDYICIFA